MTSKIYNHGLAYIVPIIYENCNNIIFNEVKNDLIRLRICIINVGENMMYTNF
jgi:hypothetical protein